MCGGCSLGEGQVGRGQVGKRDSEERAHREVYTKCYLELYTLWGTVWEHFIIKLSFSDCYCKLPKGTTKPHFQLGTG